MKFLKTQPSEAALAQKGRVKRRSRSAMARCSRYRSIMLLLKRYLQ